MDQILPSQLLIFAQILQYFVIKNQRPNMLTMEELMPNLSSFHLKEDQFQKNTISACTAKESQQKNLKQKMSGAWSSKEHIAYFKFVIINRELFYGTNIRKKMRVFKKMSESIETRETSQCKSHHQKVMKSNDNKLDKVIEYGIRKYAECFETNITRRIIKTLKSVSHRNQQFYSVHQSKEGLLIQLNSKLVSPYQQIC